MKTYCACAIVSASSCLVSTCAFNLFETKQRTKMWEDWTVSWKLLLGRVASWKGKRTTVYFFKSSPLFIDWFVHSFIFFLLFMIITENKMSVELLNDIKEGPNRWKDVLGSLLGRHNIIKLAYILKCSADLISVRIPIFFFV